jgi:hypothetical protein
MAGLVVVCLAAPHGARAQVADSTRADSIRADSIRTTLSDSARTSTPDTVRADTVRTPELGRGVEALPVGRQPGAARPRPAPQGDGGDQLKAPVKVEARDSLVLVFSHDASGGETGGDRATAYGEAKATYQDAALEAHAIEVRLDAAELHARSEAPGRAEGRPRFTQAEEEGFTGERLAYNLRTERGRVVAAQRAVTPEGFVRGRVVKVLEDSTIFVRDGIYTTCDCPPDETPSYSLRADQMKLKGSWVYTGPMQLFIFNVPTPFWLPFGFLPSTQGRRSGPLPPQYGEDQRGFFLSNWGWYFAMNDYTDLQLTAGVWSGGSYELGSFFRYNRRYRYRGSLRLNYRRNQQGERPDPNFSVTREAGLAWQHSQTVNPTLSVSGNVNLVTNSRLLRANQNANYDDIVRQTISSDVSVRKRWDSGQSLSLSASHRQTFPTPQDPETVRLTLPTLNFSQGNVTPFARNDGSRSRDDERWYERISFSYSARVNNRFDYRPLTDRAIAQRLELTDDSLSVEDSTALAHAIAEVRDVSWFEAFASQRAYRRATGEDERFDFQATHNLPFSTNFDVRRFNLTLAPRVETSSDWFIRTTRLVLDRDTTVVLDAATGEPLQTDAGTDSIRVREQRVRQSVPGFFAQNRVSTSLSATTEFFGTFPVGVGPFQGLRHRVRPNLSFRYQPNFNTGFFGETRLLRDENGEVVTNEDGAPVRYNIVSGNETRGSTEQRSMSFGLDNTFETKRVRIDSTGARQEQRISLLNLNANSSYNFVAEEFKLSDVSVSARTNALPQVQFNASMTLSPYAVERVDEDALQNVVGRYRLSDNPRQRLRLTRRERAQVEASEAGRRVEVDRYLFRESPLRPLRMTRFSFTASTSFQGRAKQGRQRRRARDDAGITDNDPDADAGGNPEDVPPGISTVDLGDRIFEDGYGTTPIGYADFGIPWTLSFNFRYSVSRALGPIQNRRTQVNTTFNANVTPNWRVQGNSGYDFVQKTLVVTQMSVARDLGCWQMSFQWIPFGRAQSYGFQLRLKSGPFADLLRLNVPQDPRGGFFDRVQGAATDVANVQQ